MKTRYQIRLDRTGEHAVYQDGALVNRWFDEADAHDHVQRMIEQDRIWAAETD